MNTLWGETNSKMVIGVTEIELEHSVIAPNFVVPANIMHESKLNGKRTWSRKNKFVEFVHAEYLFKYADPGATATTLLQYEDTVVTYHFLSGSMIQEMYIERIEIHPLFVEDIKYEFGVAIMYLKNQDYLIIQRRLKFLDGKFVKFLDGKFAKTRGIVI